MSDRPVCAGNAYPLGPTLSSEGTNFSVFSASAKRMEIVLFDHADALQPARVIDFDPVFNRTDDYWHIFVPGIKPGQLYGYRADGPTDPANGQRFDSQKVLIDPYGKSVSVGRNYDRAAACKPGDNAATSIKSVLADLNTFDWEGDTPLHRPFGSTVIYELHVAGFTRHPSSGIADGKRGTYLGVIEKIPYLQELGITAECRPIRNNASGNPRWSAFLPGPGLAGYFPHSRLKRRALREPVANGDAVIQTMKACDLCKASNCTVTFSAQVSEVRKSSDYTPRIVPYHPAASLPLEAGQIVWLR